MSAEAPAAEKEKEKKAPMKRSNSFSRRGNRGKKQPDDSAVGAGASAAPGGGTAGPDDSYADDAQPVVAKPEFKLEEQADPVRDAIQREAVALFEKGAYDDAGEKFYYLAEAAHNAGDGAQECTALQNMGTSLVMMGSLFEASRCYESAMQLALSAGSDTARVEVLSPLYSPASAEAHAWRPHSPAAPLHTCRCSSRSSGATLSSVTPSGPSSACKRFAACTSPHHRPTQRPSALT